MSRVTGKTGTAGVITTICDKSRAAGRKSEPEMRNGSRGGEVQQVKQCAVKSQRRMGMFGYAPNHMRKGGGTRLVSN